MVDFFSAVKVFLLLLPIASMWWLERVFQKHPLPKLVKTGCRVQYPLWFLLGLDNIVEVTWLLGLYGCGLALFVIRQYRGNLG
ncbi:hypothetical protein H6G00_01600 [Leptolyngbya sp. FACHB-541]|uniref:hypothetical protein n=1 Tax=Leptolyngbya sp. FACHB-541 TaxID=2692810 RepID=UPI001681C47B|nr:hypothetical protein [Leptolyngbya sp. FACHB-541]MBD1995325.1 hypothetical protein [Leptolyngbya sp. FACHB-541]